MEVYSDIDGYGTQAYFLDLMNLPKNDGWNTYDLTSQSWSVSGNFWIGVRQYTPQEPYGLDTNTNSGNSHHMTISPPTPWTPVTGEVGFRVTLSNEESFNPTIQLKQDGGKCLMDLGMEGLAGTLFSNSLANARYILAHGADTSPEGFQNAIQFATSSTADNPAARMTILENGNVGIGTNAPQVPLHINSTDALQIPKGTTGEQSTSPSGGYLRFNTTDSSFEGYNSSAWINIEMPVATTLPVVDTTDTTTYLCLFDNATGDLGPKTDTKLIYNSSGPEDAINPALGIGERGASSGNLTATYPQQRLHITGSDTRMLIEANNGGQGSIDMHAYFGGTTRNLVRLITDSTYPWRIHSHTSNYPLIFFNETGNCGIGWRNYSSPTATETLHVKGNIFASGQTRSTSQLLTDQATITWNLDGGNAAEVTLEGNRTLGVPTNDKDGGIYILRVKQDVTGSRTLAYHSDYVWPNNTAPTLTTAGNSMDTLTFISDGTKMYGIASLNYTP